VADVFDGPAGLDRVSAASITTLNSNARQLAYRWSNITVPPGGSVAYLHFGVQQTSRAAAQASAGRLIQLPPEALAGLTPDELSAIRNFAVPVDGVSTLNPLPALNGSITGTVLAGDGATPVPNTTVRFRATTSSTVRTQFAYSDANGAFSFASTFNNFGSSVAIPIDAFTLTAVHPQTNVSAPTTIGNFPAGQNDDHAEHHLHQHRDPAQHRCGANRRPR